MITASRAAILTEAALRLRKRLKVPVTLLPWIARGEFWASDAAESGLLEVSAGIPSHRIGIRITPITIWRRIAGCERQAQITYRPIGAHTSGRPRAASHQAQKAQR